MTTQHGGKREGSGRPKGALSEKQQLKKAITLLFMQEAEKAKGDIIEAFLQQCKDGDVKSIIEYFQRTMGKVIDEVKLNEDSSITVIVKNYADTKTK